MRWVRLSLLALFIGQWFAAPSVAAASTGLAADQVKEIEAYITSNLKKSKIPGLSVVIVKDGETAYRQGFGYADTAAKQPVTATTLFELGSTTKAFTALAVLQLEEQGLLNLNDPVTRYLPWFQLSVNGRAADITLRQLLYHTSGIPFKTIGDIPVDAGEGALERTVRNLVGQELDFVPGEKYLYATVNYDVLGLIIQQVTGQTYERYMTDHILQPLGLNQTYLFRADAGTPEIAQGYKLGFLRTAAYDAPAYRGNTPAAYLITNALDIEKWLKIQLGSTSPAGFGKPLIERSHLPDTTVSPSPDGASYAAGWSVFQRGSGEIAHEGSNPNYSSFIIFRPHDGLGVAVLANLDSAYTYSMGQGIMNIMLDKKLPNDTGDMYQSIDNMASTVLFISIPVILLTLWFIAVSVMQAIRGIRSYEGNAAKVTIVAASFLIVMGGFAYCLYRIPDVLYSELNWNFIRVWAPFTLPAAVLSVFTAVLLFSLYFVFALLFPKPDDKSLFVLIMLSMASGFGNALIIFVVNAALNRGDDGKFQSGLLLYLVVGIAVYVIGQRLVRTRLIHIANNMVYQKRTELIRKLLNSSYEKIEKLEYGKIQAALNNDTETISDFSNIVITGATSLVTLICCFVYMGTISIYGLLVSMLAIVLAAGLHFFVGKQANKLWEQTRDIQNVFFAFINDLIAGFKELSMHGGKREDFKRDMIGSSQSYRDKRIAGDMKFANVNVIGELLFSLVVGSIAFLFPVLFPDLKDASIRTYVFVLLYMTGPIHGILGTIPNIFRVKISWSRINELSGQLDSVQEAQSAQLAKQPAPQHLELELREVVYRYANSEGDTFTVGPVNLAFRSGEITFITGGNGSGKSTLAKLVTGLYPPDRGEIRINGTIVDSKQLGQQYAAVFSDFHLFRKLYGIDYVSKHDDIDHYLNVLQLQGKVAIPDGIVSTLQLSTGQRKRLALLISYLEDRPVYLFDEWAADQDPEFRRFFYDKLLPELKDRGKCVIAITHDDRFFGMADRVVKMETGKVVASDTRSYAAGTGAINAAVNS
jgi:cyclic peptide transporter